MSTFGLKPLLLHPPLQIQILSPLLFFPQRSQPFAGFRRRGRLCFSSSLRAIRAERETDSKTAAEADPHVLFEETYRLKRIQLVEGKVTARLDWGEERIDVGGFNGRLVVGTDLEGSWVLHWGVTYCCDDFRSEWDQPPADMRPPSSVPIKDYAIETPLDKSLTTLEGQILHQVKIDLDSRFSIEAIHFVLKNEETGAWFQHRGRDFKIPLLNFPQEDVTVCNSQNFSIWPDNAGETKDKRLDILQVKGFYEEYPITKEEPVENSLTVSVRRDYKMDKNHLHFDTDIPCQVVVHWGVCKNSNTMWEFPASPHPAESKVFRKKAIQTTLQKKKNGVGSWGLFPLDKDIFGVLFVLKLNDNSWLKNAGDDFYICLKNEGILNSNTSIDQIKVKPVERVISMLHDGATSTENKITKGPKSDIEKVQEAEYTNEIINDIRNLVTDISSEKRKITKSKNVQENILQEIENLAAEAYSIFRSSVPNFVYEPSSDSESLKPPVQVSSGIGSGYEVLFQGFNWETHKSGRWYSDLTLKAAELSKIGFTTIWLPPPSESVSPEGYMPKDLYNLNSRYGNIEELKVLVKTLHQVGIKVLGDVVLNHRCAHTKNQNGIWNIFGGQLNWDDRAIVSDDPHFQGRGNRSSGDHFHAAPNIDHSQDFVRKDIKDWLCWLRDEIGYDGWRLDFVRGFWGGYVKDYLEASRPFFAVGEYWDSLSYTYGQMDHNQDAHRQRIVDWINATNGSAGAFDVTTKGILHTAIERCEYWRLSDEKGKPPGVVGWWPSRAVTFIENHDTGSTQGHWRFPKGNEMQGYAYILTHPGTPTVFYDHIYSHYQQEIANLISLRSRLKLHCRSKIKITKVERDVYAAVLDEKVAMKIGPGHYEPPHDEGSSNNSWIVSAEGKNYKVWESIIDYKV